ncbi:MAG: dihydroorotase [Alphaproteobacteria bacterium]|jgi:dihydroorotase|nr:dihydroorotase [Alphaproteobacteria bacterium]MDP6566168.1 dihydroorotase [Alphaproteobacteria bacterium]MDP6813591.1 dihydroorotase [Alphaproteobacteria bacterium]
MSGDRIAYLNARLIDPASGLDQAGGLLTEGDTIADLGPGLFADGPPEGAEVVDCGGRVLCPGLIDMRVFVGEPGAEHKETLASASRAAAAGGVTCIIVQPNTEPVIDEVALVEYLKRQARDKAVVRIHPMAAITKGLGGQQMAELGLLAEADAVAFTDADRAVADAGVMRRVLSYASAFDLLICQYPEEPSLGGGGVMNAGEVAMRLGLPGKPTQAETIMIERDLRLVEMTQGRYHAAALSTAQAIEAMRAGKSRGLPVTAAAAVHNFALNETAVGEYRTFTKTAPPLRDEADREAVVAGLADGAIDVICSCHEPQDAESKRLPFELAATGIIGLETMLPLALELYHNGRIDLLALLGKMTAAPAALLGLRGGKLNRGAPADLLIFDPDVPWRIDEGAFRSTSKNSPYDGRPVQGRAWRTVVAGRAVFDDEQRI